MAIKTECVCVCYITSGIFVCDMQLHIYLLFKSELDFAVVVLHVI